jgi:hypothetical protein
MLILLVAPGVIGDVANALVIVGVHSAPLDTPGMLSAVIVAEVPELPPEAP